MRLIAKVKKLIKDKRAQVDVSAVAIALVIAAVTLGIGIYVFASIFTNLPAVNDTQAQAAISNVQTITYNAFQLLPVALIVLAAVAIMAAIYMIRGG